LPSDALTGSRYPSSTDAPNIPQHIQNAVFDLADNTIPRFTSTTARNTAYSTWVTQGGVMTEGLYCHVNGLGLMVYSGGAWRSERTGWLNDVNPTTNGSVTGGTATTIASITVTIPAGLHTGQRIKVQGGAFISTPGGVGAGILIQGGSERSINVGNISGDLKAKTRFDASLTAGSRTYNLQTRATVSGGVVTWEDPWMEVEIVG
jgi:hypothetical protein